MHKISDYRVTSYEVKIPRATFDKCNSSLLQFVNSQKLTAQNSSTHTHLSRKPLVTHVSEKTEDYTEDGTV